MSTSSTVERAFEAALYADSDAALDTGASLLAADPASDAELARRGRSSSRRPGDAAGSPPTSYGSYGATWTTSTYAWSPP